MALVREKERSGRLQRNPKVEDDLEMVDDTVLGRCGYV